MKGVGLQTADICGVNESRFVAMGSGAAVFAVENALRLDKWLRIDHGEYRQGEFSVSLVIMLIHVVAGYGVISYSKVEMFVAAFWNLYYSN